MSTLSEITDALDRTAMRIRLRPGTPAHQKEMTASKVAAVLGLSSQESRFSLWYRMAGQVEPRPSTRETQRGHYLEDAVTRYVRDEVGLSRVVRAGTWRNRERRWQVASPDRLAVPHGWEPSQSRAGEIVVIEAKTAADWDEWGAEGTDEIPPGYRTQVVYQLDTLGLAVAYVGVLLPRLVFRCYEIRPEPGEAEFVRDAAKAFLDTLPRDGKPGTPPDVDEHGQTYVALRELHPEIRRGQDEEIPRDLAARYVSAVLGRRGADTEYQHATNLLAAHMGEAHKAVFDGVTLADRRSKNGGRPFLNPATRLPAIPPEETPERTDTEQWLIDHLVVDPTIPDGEIHVVGATTAVINTTQEEPAP